MEPGGAWPWPAPQQEEGPGPHPDLGAIPLIAQPLAFQICPSLEHASLVLLNAVLDTVPGECCPGGRDQTPLTMGRAEPCIGLPGGPQAWSRQHIFPGSEELRG